METVSIHGQSLFDIAIQESGGIESVFEIAEQNGVSVTDQLSAGQPLTIPTINNLPIADYFRVKNIAPVTGNIEDLGGIGYMAISIDFKVS